MKYQIMMGILFTLLGKRKVSARYLAEKYEVSERSIYRYIDELCIANVPIMIERGRKGGIYISDTYRLPANFLTEDEYNAAISALDGLNVELNDKDIESAVEKLKSQLKTDKKSLTITGNFIIDSGSWGDTNFFTEKIKVIQDGIEESRLLEIDYRSLKGENTTRQIEPHVLVLKQNIWYVYAFCHLKNEFRLFKVGRIRKILLTDKRFKKADIKKEDIPLNFWRDEDNGTVDVRFEIDNETLPVAEEWLGADNVISKDGKNVCEVNLPYDGTLISKIISMGSGLKVVYPEEIRQKVSEEVKKILNNYS